MLVDNSQKTCFQKIRNKNVQKIQWSPALTETRVDNLNKCNSDSHNKHTNEASSEQARMQ